MSVTVYVISAVLVFVFAGVMAMAGIGAAFLFVPLFFYLGVPLAQATPTALLLNVVSLLFATINYWRGKLINFRLALPMLIVAVALSPIGARVTPFVDQRLLLGLFAAFLLFAGAMMLFYKATARAHPLDRKIEVGVGVGVGGQPAFWADCSGSVAGTSSSPPSPGWESPPRWPPAPRR